jgi:hypothetical protein
MIIENDIITIEITEDILKSAKNFNYPVNKKSYMHGERHEVGAIGEIIAFNYLKAQFSHVYFSEVYDYDILVDNNEREWKIDVKTKKRTSCGLDKLLNYKDLGYEGSVQAESLEQLKQKDLDFYMFINYDGQKAYLIGWISKADFIEKCYKVKKNSVDPTNGLLMQGENFNIYYKDLNPFKQYEIYN